jgi:peptidoglycan/LPS O-acetylase OafA/YrhL
MQHNQTGSKVSHKSEVLTLAGPWSEDPAKVSFWPQLNGLRAVAILLVFIAHIEPFPDHSSLFGIAFSKLSAACVFAVDQFFVLSAYLLTMLLLREREKFGIISIKHYYIRRALRIWPLYFLAVFSACFLLPLLAVRMKLEPFVAYLVQQFFPLITFTANFTLTFTQNSLYVFSQSIGMPLVALIIPLWSISCEEQFYAVCPFIAQRIRFTPPFFIALFSALIGSTVLRVVLCRLALQNNISHFLWFFNTLARLEPFLLGILIATAMFFLPSASMHIRRLLPAIIGVASVIWTVLILIEPMNMNTEAFLIPLVALAAGATLLASLYCRPLMAFLSTPPMFYLGQLSFSMYVLHKPILWTLARLFSPHFPVIQAWWVTMIAGGLITFLGANITYHLIEKRFLTIKANLFERKSETLSTNQNT